MEDFLVWIFWAVIIIGSIASSASKAKKQREAEARRRGQGVERPVAPVAPSQTVVPRPAAWQPFAPLTDEAEAQARAESESESEAASRDYYSLETEYDATDGRGYRESYNADDMSFYEKLAAERASRKIIDNAAIETPAAEEDAVSPDTDGGTSLRELLGSDFNLRRAVIESEILTPKYTARY